MPDKGLDEKQSPVSKEARARRSWWYKASRFMIRDTGMYDMGDNANLNITENLNHINAGVVFIMDRSASSASHIDPSPREGENGPPDSYWTIR